MKLLYITSVNLENKNFLGVEKKIASQIKGFKENGIEAEHINFLPVKNSYLTKINRRINPFSCNSYIDLNRKIEYEKFDILYIRYTLADYKFIKLLKTAKKINSNIKIIVEIPTYPYDGEYKSMSKIPIIIKDRLFRGELKKYVDNIVTFSSDDIIYNIKTIKINNGIDLNNVTLRNYISSEEDTNRLNILAVANVSFWHGYDRIIKGIDEYYKNINKENKKDIHFYIVGSGGEIGNLKELSKKLNVDERVHFEGFKSGKELDEIFNKAHIAVDHLGLHRKGMRELSSLKSKEYSARGIPFVLSHKDKAFEGYKYILNLPVNDEPIDINTIIEFKDNVYKNKHYIKEMRSYASMFSWTNIMNLVISKL